MNPLSGCTKGYKKCIKNCYQAEKCQSCPYLKECCHRYCVIFPPATSRAINTIAQQVKADPFVQCIESVLKRHL